VRLKPLTVESFEPKKRVYWYGKIKYGK
jgi:hypothetical protein